MPADNREEPLVPQRGRIEPRALFFFEKWYFDGQTEDGAFFFAYLAPLVLAGRRSAELVVSLFPAGGNEHRLSLHLAGGVVESNAERTRVALPGGEIELGSAHCRVRLRLEQADLDLSYRPLEPPWAPRGDGILLGRGRRRLRWVVPLPLGRLQGSVRVRDGEQRFDGLGYADFVQTDIAPWSLPLRELVWGRALAEDLVVVWNRVSFRPGSQCLPGLGDTVGLGLARLGTAGETLSLAGAEAELGEMQQHTRTGGAYPRELRLRLGAAQEIDLRLDDTRLLLGERVADVQGFGSGPQHWLYRKLTGDAVEYKLLSRMTAAGRTALAAHEVVHWGCHAPAP
ncbi:MAG: hypothetical protein HY744_03390 [Deltaproteobacteria bacterium]|nr:hypothetical protein [Deltaproteobacteria bacterium]